MRQKTKLLDRHLAGPDRAVLSFKKEQEGAEVYRRQPCGKCPWRKDAVGEFPAEAFRRSAETAYDMSRHLFSCHESGMEKPAICAGFIISGSVHNLGMRLKTRLGMIDPGEVTDGGNPIFGSYREMAEANGVDPGDPILKLCR